MTVDAKEGEELFPWRKQGRKPRKRVGSLPEQTSLKCKVRSKPKVEGQEFLDLYLMMKEKERLEKFGEVMGKTQKQTREGWKDMVQEIGKVGRKAFRSVGDDAEPKGRDEGGKVEKRVPRTPMKKMTLDY